MLRLTDDDDATLDDIALTIRNDPGLAGQLLKVANSPMYGMGGEVASLSRAASILGLRTVKLLSLSFAVVASTSGSNGDALIWRRTWRQAHSAKPSPTGSTDAWSTRSSFRPCWQTSGDSPY